MTVRLLYLLFFWGCIHFPSSAQLLLGKASSEINFREGAGTNFKIKHSVNNSNLLVVLPREPQNGFVETFDVETSSLGFVSASLIQITDTLEAQNQKFFEKSGVNTTGDIEIVLINKTNHSLFVWINKNAYNLAPFEKKTLVFDTEEIVYFSSSPGLYPIFGKETLKKGDTYNWRFSL